MPFPETKALIKKSKTIKFEILSRCAFTSAWFLVTFKKCELQTYRYTDTHTNQLLYAFGACTLRHNEGMYA